MQDEPKHMIVLSDRDRDVFLEALANPPEPSPRLRAALERHHQSDEKEESDA